MKRVGNLYSKIYNINNLKLADKIARKGKGEQKGILKHDNNAEDNIINLYHILSRKEYKTSDYKIFKILDPKEREIYRLSYYPDRIVHHAIMNILEPIFLNIFVNCTYNCIKGRGIHKAYKDIKRSLKNVDSTTYCLKIDINKFYPSINNNILKMLLRYKFKDKNLLVLLDGIIDSTKGVPIGNYLSQYFANFYLTYFDHWLKEKMKVKHYFRYCDDIVILHNDKRYLANLLSKIKEYLKDNLDLCVKNNHQIFPVESRGIDFVGYVFRHKYILLRKGIKKRFIKMIKYNKNRRSIASYNGWLIYCNSYKLRKKYLK